MSEWRFERESIRAFRFVRAEFDAVSGIARLVYAFDDGPELVETIMFPGAPFMLDAGRSEAVQRALRLLHGIAGVSYYKAAVPALIVIEGEGIDADTAALLTEIYENGLGEFAYRNGLQLRGKIRFPCSDSPPPQPVRPSGAAFGRSSELEPVAHERPASPPASGGGSQASHPEPLPNHPEPPLNHPEPLPNHPEPLLPPLAGEGWDGGKLAAKTGGSSAAPAQLLPLLAGEGWDGGKLAATIGLRKHALVAIGGGKDSLVSIEALRAAGVEQTVAWIGSSPLIATCAARTGLPTLNIERKLAPQLFEFNRQGAYNGHIPVTAINSAILVLAALLHGFDQVVFSNERSASYGSEILDDDGRVVAQVNHQWSKGWAFERAFGEHVERHVASDLHYYSLLRPLSELAVARQFANTDRYDAYFSSCNRNFHILGERPVNRWCGQCPKCHFVFLALAPFMPKPRLLNIFGRNLLDDAALAPGFDALIEYRDHKPFECVGEGREARAVFAALTMRPAWREDALVTRFAQEIQPQLGANQDSIAELLPPGGDHRIPSLLWEKLRAHFAA